MKLLPLVQALRNAGAVSNDWLGKLAVGLVRVYQAGVSVVMTPSCRFFPSCSAYCIEAVQVYGPWRGLALGARRIARCHPWNAGGVDLVPARRHP